MVIYAAIISMVVLDQLIKMWAIRTLQPIESIPVLSDIFHLTYVENRGAAFSILQNKLWLFIIITTVILGIIIYALKSNKIKTALGKWSVYFIIGGAIGNLIDRVMRGYVVDLFDFRLIHFPVFNIADVFVCIGGALFCFYVLFQHDEVK